MIFSIILKSTLENLKNTNNKDLIKPKLSVIIPSYCSKYLKEAVNAVQEINPYEIIVVDTSPVKPNISNVILHHQYDRLSPSEARNKGASLAKGDLLLFTDSDIILDKSSKTIENEILYGHKDNVICGLYKKTPGENKISSFQRGILERRLGKLNRNKFKISSSSHFLIRRNAFNLVGGFNETIDYYEDVEFFLRCKVFGLFVKLDPSFTAVHLKEFNLKSLLKDYWNKTFTAIETRLKTPKLFKGNLGDIPFSMHLSGLSGCIAIFLLINNLIKAIFLIGTPSITFGYLSPLIFIFLSFYLFPRSALKISRLLSSTIWILCYITICFAVLLSTTKTYLKKFQLFVVSFSDFFRNGLRVLFRNGRPVQIINYVTSRCNLRCSHCFYKDSLNNPNPGEIPRENLLKMMKDIGPVLWYSLAGGEPFIRPDLETLIQDVHQNCRPKVFSFPTNGWYTERTFKTVLRSLQRLHRGNIILFFSLEGSQLIHDEIRGKGSYENLLKTIERLKPLKKIYKNLYINYIMTVTPQNASEAPKFIKEVARNFNADSISINLIREHKPNAPKLPNYLLDAYEETIDSYAEEVSKGNVGGYKFVGSKFLRAKEFLQKQLIIKVARNNDFVTPCTAGTLSYVIMEDGSVKPCEILFDQIGNIYDDKKSFLDIINSSKTKKLRKWIKDTECRCTYECAMSTNTLFSLPMIPKLIYKTLFPDAFEIKK